jgi:starch phosphorylase
MDLVEKYMGPRLKPFGIAFERLSKFGVVDGNRKVFWLTAFAIQFSRYINAVSKQHAEVSRKIWSGIFPQKPVVEVPINNITNGIHRYWISEHFTYILSRYIGPEHIHGIQNPKVWARIFDIPYEEIWEAHRRNKQDMVNFVRGKLASEMTARGHLSSRVFRSSRTLNPEYMTIVFARRFASYKRPMLILHDKERLKKILLNTRKPVQLIFSGKAHPDDAESKAMIREIIEFSKDPAIEGRVIFLENYDMNIARHLVWGADVWLNNPMADMEASGTSGMKAGMNGVLQLSTLEGWWKEGYNGRNGWSINAGGFYRQEEIKEAAEANQLYELLEDEITELYYERNDAGIPEMWVRMMKEAIYSICQNYNMNTVLSTYLSQSYLPAKKETERLAENNNKLLKEFSAEESLVLKYWDVIKPVTFQTNMEQEDRVFEGEVAKIDCTVYLDQAPTEAFKVELFYMFRDNTEYRVLPMELVERKDQMGYYSCLCPIEGYGLQSINARIRPANELVADSHPELIKWAG